MRLASFVYRQPFFIEPFFAVTFFVVVASHKGPARETNIFANAPKRVEYALAFPKTPVEKIAPDYRLSTLLAQ
jgi:hypothetical protein